MELKLTILGCGSAAPSLLRANTAQVLEIGGKTILIDCGEGTQIELLRRKIRAFKIDYIFISHLHGDHFLGLPGLLNTLSLYGRTKPLKIFGPRGIKKLLSLNFRQAEMPPSFLVKVKEIASKKCRKLMDENGLIVKSVPLSHRIPCYGYHFEMHIRSMKIKKDKCDAEGLDVAAIRQFKAGMDYEKNGKLFKCKDFTTKISHKKSYTFITDTLYLPEIVPHFFRTDLLYHESTYLNNLLDKALLTYHSTAAQAAEMARNARAGLLILGHFSSRYMYTSDLLEEARNIFPRTELAEDGKVFILK